MVFGEYITELIEDMVVTAPDATTAADGQTICNNYGIVDIEINVVC